MLSTKHELVAIVHGITWGGWTSSVEYVLKPSEVDNYKTLEDFKRVGGDFETIFRVELLESTVVTNTMVKLFD